MAFKSSKKKKTNKTKTVLSISQIDNINTQHPVKASGQHLTWVFYYAMYLGHQYTTANYENDELETEEVMANSRSIYNYLQGYNKLFNSKLLKDDPTPQVVPITFDTDDIRRARTSSVVLESWWKKQNLASVLYDMAFWSSITGTAIIKQYWNKDAGMKTNIGDISIDEGEVTTRTLSPWSTFPDPTATDMDTCRYFCETYTQSLMTMERNYPKLAGKLKPDDTLEDYKSIIASYTGDNTETNQTSSLTEEKVLVIEYWERAVQGYDAGYGEGKGALIIRAGGQTVYAGENPKGMGLPYYRYTVNDVPDSFWGKGMIEPALQPQIDLNRVTSQTMENIDWMGNQVYLLPEGCNAKEEDFGKTVATIIRYNPEMGEPKVMQHRAFPTEVLQFKSHIEQAMMAIYGLHEVSQGQLPERGSQMSSRSLDILVESETVRFAPEINRLKDLIEKIAEDFLDTASKRYIGKKTIAMLGKVNGIQAIEYTNDDLKSNRGIIVEVGKGFGLSAQRKSELALQLFDRGIIQDPKEVMNVVEFGTTNRLFYENSLAENKGIRYLKKIVEGTENEEGELVVEPPPFSEYDPHAEFIKVFREFMLTPEYDEVINQEQRDLIDAFMQVHLEAIQPPQQEGQGQAPPPQEGQANPMMQSEMDASLQNGGRPPQGLPQ